MKYKSHESDSLHFGYGKLDLSSGGGIGIQEKGINFGMGINKGFISNSKKKSNDFSHSESLQKEPHTKFTKEATIQINKLPLKEARYSPINGNKDLDSLFIDRIKTEDGFSFRQNTAKAGGRPSSAYYSESRGKAAHSVHGGDESSAKESSQNFLSNLNKLKEFNSRGASVAKEVQRNEREGQLTGVIMSNSDFNVGINKKAGIFASLDHKQSPTPPNPAERLGTLQSNQRHLDLKRTELRGRLNELLDKLAVSNPAKGETRSVAPQLARDGDDNLSLNSFHSTAPQASNLKSSAAGGFTSFYK